MSLTPSKHISVKHSSTYSSPERVKPAHKVTVKSNSRPELPLFKQPNRREPLPKLDKPNKRTRLSQSYAQTGERLPNITVNAQDTISVKTSNKAASKVDSLLSKPQQVCQSIARVPSSGGNAQRQIANKDGIPSAPPIPDGLLSSLNYKTVTFAPIELSHSTTSSSKAALPSSWLCSQRRKSAAERSDMTLRNSSSVGSRSSHLSLLDFGESLSAVDVNKFKRLREQVPDEFRQLLPVLFRLGITRWPTKLFKKDEVLTAPEVRLRSDITCSIENYQKDIEQQRYLKSKYGGILPPDDVLHKHKLLRENLSLHGQLSLFQTYRDEIEETLAKRVPNWTSLSTDLTPLSLRHASIVMKSALRWRNSSQPKLKPLPPTTLPKSTSLANSPTRIDEKLFSETLPNNVDSRWPAKLLALIIVKAMEILDQVRKIRQTNTYNGEIDESDCSDINMLKIVQRYKQLLLLWATLYEEK